MVARKAKIEVWPDYDAGGDWILRMRKARGELTLAEITDEARAYNPDVYALVIKAYDTDGGLGYDPAEPEGDEVMLYRADDFFKRDAQ